MSRLEQIQKMLAGEPGDVFLNFSLAMEYLNADQPAEAVNQFARVIEIDPDYIPAYFQRGNALVSMDRKDQAKEVFAEGIAAAQRIGDQHAATEMGKLRDLLK